jgi:hypothetical protein
MTDTWSDPDQSLFMAVTAHWIESVEKKTCTGTEKKLQLRSDLVRFYKLPRCHTGEYLAYCFLFITNRLKITAKVSEFNLVIYNEILDQLLYLTLHHKFM